MAIGAKHQIDLTITFLWKKQHLSPAREIKEMEVAVSQGPFGKTEKGEVKISKTHNSGGKPTEQ